MAKREGEDVVALLMMSNFCDGNIIRLFVTSNGRRGRSRLTAMIAVNDIVFITALSRAAILAIQRDEAVPNNSVTNKVLIEVPRVHHQAKTKNRSLAYNFLITSVQRYRTRKATYFSINSATPPRIRSWSLGYFHTSRSTS